MSARNEPSDRSMRRYATLVGRVDEAITRLERMTQRQSFDWFHVQQIAGLLKAALLEAEEAYIDEQEQPPEGRLIVLAPRERR